MDISTILNKATISLNLIEEKVKKSRERKFFIFDHQKDILFREVHFELKQVLKQLFGKSSDSADYGLFNDLFKTTEPGYNRGVMFAYWSFYGLPYNSSKGIKGKWRDNLFYKGSRFSEEKLKANFYDFFNIVSKYCENECRQSNAPVDFFVRHARIEKLKNSSIDLASVVFVPENTIILHNSIIIPVKETLSSVNYYNIPELKTLIEDLYSVKEDKEICTDDYQRENLKIKLEKTLSSNLETAFRKLKNVENSKFSTFSQDIKNKFSHINLDNSNHLYEIFCLYICFQFYDHSGITHIYLPSNIKESNSCLGILVPFEKENIINAFSEQFSKIIESFSRLSIIEGEIFEIVKNNIVLKDIWKAHYLSKAPLYESLCLHFKVLLKYICRKEKIKILSIAHRVKEFDSFFNRAIDRFNEPSRFQISDDDISSYRDHFLSGDEDSVEKIFSRFWDISGIRILCIFKDDMKKIKEKLCKAETNLCDLKNPYDNTDYHLEVNYFDKSSFDDYRAEHYILKLGKNREYLPELKELNGLLCELQVKTTLSQGWSDADHDLFYKSALPLDQIEIHRGLKEGRAWTSSTLNEIDTRFIELRDSIKKILDDF